MVSLSSFDKLRMIPRRAQDDHGEPVALRQAQGVHGELVEPSAGSGFLWFSDTATETSRDQRGQHHAIRRRKHP